MQFGNVHDRRNDEPSGYCTAQVCLSGHIITNWIEDFPEHMEEFCSKCGKPTITTCPRCKTGIRGHLRGGGVSLHRDPPPTFCFKCGAGLPWAEANLSAARELIDLEDGLLPDARAALMVALLEVATDTERTAVGAARLRRVWGQLSPALQQAIGRLATDGAKTVIGGR